MIPKPVATITTDDIRSLIDNAVGEVRSYEYKRTLPGTDDDGKREFLSDVCSFANGPGGDIIYGVDAKDGVPVEALGLDGLVEDKEILRLESMIRDGIVERIPGIEMQPVPGFAKGPVLVLRVPRSWIGPHMVSFKRWTRFFGRGTAGKFEMDLGQIRGAFAQAEELPERMRQWHMERVACVLSGETPVPLAQGAKLLLHLIPIASFGRDLVVPIGTMESVDPRPFYCSSFDSRINIDGRVTFGGPDYRERGCAAYCQVFRNGRMETVSADLVVTEGGRNLIGHEWIEKELLGTVQRYLKSLQALGVSPPIVVMASAVGTRGAGLTTASRIDRNHIRLPEVVINGYDEVVARVMRPMVDGMWNAAGARGSPSYNPSGDWVPRSRF